MSADSADAASGVEPKQLLWVMVGTAPLRWAVWDRDNVVYHPETGETHLLSELPTLVLQRVQTGAVSTAQLCSETATACGVAADDAWRAKIEAIVRSLANLELIEHPCTAIA
jgi:PqqD family protein of HPr-rel-A system